MCTSCKEKADRMVVVVGMLVRVCVRSGGGLQLLHNTVFLKSCASKHCMYRRVGRKGVHFSVKLLTHTKVKRSESIFVMEGSLAKDCWFGLI